MRLGSTIYTDGVVVNRQKTCFEEIEGDCRENFRDRFQSFGYTYLQFAPAYRYGYSLADNERYRGKDWTSVEREAFLEWESENPATWEQVREAIRYAFCNA
jgi:hypothetical protein